MRGEEPGVRDRIVLGSSEMLEELAEAGAATGDPRLALREILVQQFLGATRHPRITQWHLPELLAGKATDASARYWTEFFALFFRRVRPLLAAGPEEEQRLSVVQLWSALILPGMMPGFFSEFAGADLRGEEAAGRYVDRLLEGVLEEGTGNREQWGTPARVADRRFCSDPGGADLRRRLRVRPASAAGLFPVPCSLFPVL
jgi:hypothetical protein